MKLSSLLWLGAGVSSVAACEHDDQEYKRTYDIAQEEIAKLGQNLARRSFDVAQEEVAKHAQDVQKSSFDIAKEAIVNLDHNDARREFDHAQQEQLDHHDEKRDLEERQLFGITLSLGNLFGTTKKTTTTTTRTSSRTTTTTTTTKTTTTSSKTTTTTARTSSSTSSSRTSSTTSSSARTSSTASSSSKASSTFITTTTSSTVTTKSSPSQSLASGQNLTNSTNSTNSTTGAPGSNVLSTILVIARDATSARQATNGLNGYGIPFQTLIVPSTGAALPALNTTAGGNFGGIIIVSGISYFYSDTNQWRSGLTNDQYAAMYQYQLDYKVRMVQWDVYPQDAFGTTNLGSCCDSGVEQLIYFTNTTAFPQAGLKTGPGAALGSQGLWHYNTQITDPSTTTEIARFAANSQYSSSSVAAVLNNFAGREQMAFFIDWATDWSPTSNYLQHAYITWMTRGLYAGYRRVGLQTQIDDVMLPTGIYYPGNSNTTYRITPDDMNTIKNWVGAIKKKLNPGSFYTPELGYNGNGNLRAVDPLNQLGVCNGGPIYTRYDTTTLEFQKPLGTGVDGWPTTPTDYAYTYDCINRDPLSVWFQDTTNRDTFMHISHTFTHEGQNNATYNDIYKEINWNQKWFAQTGISSGAFSDNSLIPPAITGLHNGDALRAWYDNGLRNCVGDNSRPLLRNQQNPMWPYITNMASNGFDGMVVLPRWSLRIYYNCDTQACTTQEWKDSTGVTGDFTALMGAEAWDSNVRLFGLYRDGNMFHQLNLRSTDMPTYTTADGTVVGSLLQAWTEQTVQEFNRLANWPLVSIRQKDLAVQFMNRMTRDQCNYNMAYTINSGKVVGVTVTATNNQCGATIPITVPGPVLDTQGFTTEKLGNDPLTVWVQLSGQPVTLTLATPIQL